MSFLFMMMSFSFSFYIMTIIHNRFPIFAFMLCILSIVTISRAQERPSLLIGLTGGYERVGYNTDLFPALNIEPSTYIAQNAKGKGYYYGVSLEHSFLLNERLYYLFEFGYNSMPATFEGYLTNGDTAVSLRTVLSYYTINWGVKYDFSSDSIPRGFGIQACLSIGSRNEANYWKSVTVNSSTATNVSSDPMATALRIAIRSELTYDLPLTNYWIVTPSVGYDFPLTKVDPNNNWRANALYGGAAVRYVVW
ncbi:MAG TPA: hypothetical protein VGM92_15545 [Candidatus Kapabacteria bacterium]